MIYGCGISAGSFSIQATSEVVIMFESLFGACVRVSPSMFMCFLCCIDIFSYYQYPSVQFIHYSVYIFTLFS